MAGSIIINDKTAVAFNSRGFEIVSESIRRALEAVAPDLIAPVYESKDIGYMPFISVDTLDGAGVQHFHAAANQALLKWKQHNSETFPEWNELIDKLEADERFKQI